MIPGSKVHFHGKLACKWKMDFMTRPNMSKKWGPKRSTGAFSPRIVVLASGGGRSAPPASAGAVYWGGLWDVRKSGKAGSARNNPGITFDAYIII